VARVGNPRVLMIGLDAMEISLIRRWMEEGALPHLAALRARGAAGELASSARWLIGSPWPTFYTGTPPEEHGFYHYLMWRPHSMATERPSPAWLPLRPFWRRLGEVGRRAIAVDPPLVYPPEPFAGIEISGWGTRELLDEPATHPPEVLQWARSVLSQPVIPDEATYPLTPAELLAVRDRWIDTNSAGRRAVRAAHAA
jgi:predicted AlkP superfamily phosphohydrolase/phosphomutase